MKINDQRPVVEVCFNELTAGSVYVWNEMYVIATNGDFIVNLNTGELIDSTCDFNCYEMVFTPVNARLEVE